MFILTDQEPPNILKLIANEVRWKLVIALAYSDYRVQELGSLLQKPLNLISYHLRLLRQDAIVHERRSSADARDVYYSLDLEHFQTLYKGATESLHPVFSENQPDDNLQLLVEGGRPTRVLFLCTHNSARSQMAEALLRYMGGPRVEVYSAGTEVSRVHPIALETLQKHNIDTTGLYSKNLSEFVGQEFDYVITVCDNAKESCPIFPGEPERIHWSFPDPSVAQGTDQPTLAFLEVFIGLEKRLRLLLAILDREQRGR